MVPRFEVLEDVSDWRRERLRVISLEEWQSGGFTATQGYSPLGPSTWREVEEACDWERTALARLDAEAASGEAFEELAEELDYSEHGGDVGACGLVQALLAAGFVTWSSCRGHVNSQWAVPFVGLVADAPHLEALDPLAAAARCRILVRPDGLVEVFSDCVSALHQLAVSMLDHAGEFDALGLVALARG